MMKKLPFALLPLTIAMATTAVAQDSLEAINVSTQNVGAKSKTNIYALEDAKKSTETDLRGALSAEPAITFGGGTGGTSQWVSIRGMGQDQIDFKIDNTYSDSQLFHHQSRFMLDPALIKRVDVKKGSGSASAGIGATSGSIEATTVDAQDLLREGQDIGFKLTAGVSSNKGHTQGATAYAKHGAFDAILSGNWTTEEEYKDGNGNKIKGSALGQRAMLAKFGVDLSENHRLVLSHRQERYHGERNLREEFDFTQSGGDVSRNGAYYKITTQDTTNLEYTGKNIGFISEVKANAYHMTNKRESTDDGTEIKVVTNGANVNFDSLIGENHLVKYGLNYRHQQAVPASLINATHNQEKDDVGAYVEGIWGFGPVTLTTGLRYDYFKFTAMNGTEASDSELNPSAGVIWEIFDGFRLNGSLNYATRSPRMYETLLASGSRGNYGVNDDLKAEKARNAEVGFNYDVNEYIALNGGYFHQHIKNIQNYGNGLIYNSGTLKNKGYEFGSAFKYGGLTLRAGMAYSKPTLNGTTYDAVVTSIPMGRTYTTGVSYKFTDPSIEIGWRGRFVEGIEYNASQTTNRGGGTSTRKAGYGVNDFYVSWDANENLTLNLAVNNAFNKYYRPHSQRSGDSSLAGEGRDVRFNVSYKF